jgi:hypothetical protein
MRAILGPLVIVVLLVALWFRYFGGNPGGISDAEYSKFKMLAPPKLLYSCTRKPTSDALLRLRKECAKSGRSGCEQKAYEFGESETATVVGFVGGQETSTYDELLRDARRKCAEDSGSMGNGVLTVLESNKD